MRYIKLIAVLAVSCSALCAQCAEWPVLFGPGKTLGMLSKDEIAFDRCRTSSADVQQLRDALDARAGGTPAVLESPFVGLMMPRVAADGSLRNVALLGLRLDEQGPVRLRLRGVPENATHAVWREIRREPVVLPIRREGGVCRVEVPSIGAWNGGFLECEGAHLYNSPPRLLLIGNNYLKQLNSTAGNSPPA